MSICVDCGLLVTSGKLSLKVNTSTEAQGCDKTKGTAFGSDPTQASPDTACGCDTGKNGLVCDSANGGKLWAPGKIGVHADITSSEFTGDSLDDFFGPISVPARFTPTIAANWVIMGPGGAEVLCWETQNITCEEVRGRVFATVSLPTFYIRPGEWFVFQLMERLASKTAFDGLPIPNTVLFNSQSIQSFDYRSLQAADLPAGVPGVAISAVLFDQSMISIGPGQIARGESCVIMRRLAGTGAVNNPTWDPELGTGPAAFGSGSYQHEYTSHFSGGHVVLPTERFGSLTNGTSTGNPCFFDT